MYMFTTGRKSELEMLVGVGVTLSIMVSIECRGPYLVLDATIGCQDFVAGSKSLVLST